MPPPPILFRPDVGPASRLAGGWRGGRPIGPAAASTSPPAPAPVARSIGFRSGGRGRPPGWTWRRGRGLRARTSRRARRSGRPGPASLLLRPTLALPRTAVGGALRPRPRRRGAALRLASVSVSPPPPSPPPAAFGAGIGRLLPGPPGAGSPRGRRNDPGQAPGPPAAGWLQPGGPRILVLDAGHEILEPFLQRALELRLQRPWRFGPDSRAISGG